MYAISIIQFCSVIVEDGIVDSGGTKGHAERWSECFLEDGIHKLKLEMQEGVYQGGVEGHRKVINQHGLLKALECRRLLWTETLCAAVAQAEGGDQQTTDMAGELGRSHITGGLVPLGS